MSERDVHIDILVKRTGAALQKNFFEVSVVQNGAEALECLKKLIPSDALIGYGGSRTLSQIGFDEHFKKGGYPNLLNRDDLSLSEEEKHELQVKMLGADYFLSSCNALSQSGELVLTDKWGNRCAGMTFGPKRRIVVVSWTKICRNLTLALERDRNVASVLNNIRFNTGNPCTGTGECTDCSSENRICGVTTILRRSFPKKSVHVIIVKEDLGF